VKLAGFNMISSNLLAGKLLIGKFTKKASEYYIGNKKFVGKILELE